MVTTKTERIEIDLPQDILFVMRGLEKPEEIKTQGGKVQVYTLDNLTIMEDRIKS